MIFKIFSLVAFILGCVVLVPIIGGWGLIHPSDTGAFWAGIAVGVVALVLAGCLWYLSRLEPVTPMGHYARRMTAALMFKNIGYLFIFTVMIAASTPAGQDWVYHHLLHGEKGVSFRAGQRCSDGVIGDDDVCYSARRLADENFACNSEACKIGFLIVGKL